MFDSTSTGKSVNSELKEGVEIVVSLLSDTFRLFAFFSKKGEHY